jgi:inosine-uridine nucleoside N-ribohydrolase
MKKVIFDTDIGIDDAMALLFLHFSPDVELQAIVTGFGNASIDDTTRNALYIKQQFRIDAPVYRGAAGPLGERLGDEYPDFVHGRNGLGDIAIPESAGRPEAMPGADAIVDLAKRYPGQFSIVAVGRLTNLALALEQCPELPKLIAEVVVMGGAFGFNGHRGNVSPVAEANIAGDPLAADRVFTSGLRTTIVGLDVTEEIIACEPFFDALRENAGQAGDFIYRISRCYLEFHQRVTGDYACPVHDSSAVAYLLDPGAFTTLEAAVRVVPEGIAIGQTICGEPDADYESTAWKDQPVCRVCTGVDADRVLGLYAETLALARN